MQRYKEETQPIYEPVNGRMKNIISSQKYRRNMNMAAIIIALLSALCALFIILSIRLYIKLRG